MDAARKSKRLYPGYTTEQLEDAIMQGRGTAEMQHEVEMRKTGVSVVFIVPQVNPDRRGIK